MADASPTPPATGAHPSYQVIYTEDGKEVARVLVNSGMALQFLNYWYRHRELFESDLQGSIVLNFDARRPSLSGHVELEGN